MKLLRVNDGKEITDVGIHELEHVDLIDHWVFKARNVTVILIPDKFTWNGSINASKHDDQDGVYNTQTVLDIPRCYLSDSLVLSADLLADVGDQHLAAEDEEHEEETDGHANQQLSGVRVFDGDALLMKGIGVDSQLTFEFRALLSDIFITTNKPLICDVVLLSLPTLIEKGDPDHDDEAVEDRNGRREELSPRALINDCIDDHCDTETESNDSHWNQPASIMDQPGEIEAKLLTVVIFDEIDRLHVAQEALEEHASRQTPFVLGPWLDDFTAFGHVHGPMLSDHTTLDQVVNIDLWLDSLCDDGLMLSTVKLVEHVSCIALEWLLTVILGQTALYL